jgi:hypothetical protein
MESSYVGLLNVIILLMHLAGFIMFNYFDFTSLEELKVKDYLIYKRDAFKNYDTLISPKRAAGEPNY